MMQESPARRRNFSKPSHHDRHPSQFEARKQMLSLAAIMM
jgi:hypothetical protein